MQKIIIIGLCVAAFAGGALSLTYSQRLRESTIESENHTAVVAMLKKENQLLKKQAAKKVMVAAVPEVEDEELLVDHDETVNDLNERLRAKDEQLLLLHARVSAMESSNTNAPPRRDDRRSWMDDLKESDPDRYKEITERREAARQAAKYEVAKKAAHFLDRDTSSMSADEAESYEEMMTLLTDTLKLTEQLDANLPWEDRRPVMHQFRDNLRDLSPMLDVERGKEFYQIGKDMGYTDDDASAFAAYLTEVVDLTSVSSIFRSSMQAMGGHSGRGGGENRENRDENRDGQ